MESGKLYRRRENMDTETKHNGRSEPDKTKITCRLKDQVSSLEEAVSAAKREAVQLFRELDMRMRKARSLALELGDSDDAWARRVSRIMDILDDCHGTMEGMAVIGLLRGSPGFSWDLGRVFDVAENDQVHD